MRARWEYDDAKATAAIADLTRWRDKLEKRIEKLSNELRSTKAVIAALKREKKAHQ